MEFLRTARNPWGDEVFLGLGWDVLWLVVIAGAAFVVIHAVFARRKATREHAANPSTASVPEMVTRHGRSARISHWILAAATLVLLVTAFVPILGLQFPWVTIHWMAGLVLSAYILFHLVDTVRRGTLGTMWIGSADWREASGRLRGFFGRTSDPQALPGKWGTENKVFHHVTALAGLGVAATGLMMMARVDTWFWAANPYAMGLSDRLWGMIYVLHGLAAVGFVGLLIAHIYFAVRPDNLWITRSMFKGWITRDEYLTHHDPGRWPASGYGNSGIDPRGGPREASGAGAPVATSSPSLKRPES